MTDFDREAVREELREKYERDQEKRKATQVMSELLLKGATMTNRHCDDCGDPIFRYQGQEFCPTCSNAQVVGGQGDGQAQGDAQPQADAQPPGESGAPHTGDDTSVEVDVEPTGASGGAATAGEEAAGSETTPSAEGQPGTGAPAAGAGVAPSGTGTAEPAGTGSTGSDDRSRSPGSRSGAPAGAGSANLAQARQSLQRTIVRYTAAAEEAQDPRRARELLAAAREAAETLAVLTR